MAAVVLAYTILNPFFFTLAEEVRFMKLVMPTLVVLAGYFAATFWSRYPHHPLIDFLCLLALAILVLGDDFVLYSEFQRLAPGRHSAIIISPLIVTAFAAFALIGHTRWFLAWLACHAAISGAVVMLFETTMAGRLYGLVSYAAGAAAMLSAPLGAGRRPPRLLRPARGARGRTRPRPRSCSTTSFRRRSPQRLKGGEIVANSFSDASVIFVDVIGFSALAKAISPGHLVDLLNAFFSLADRCAARLRRREGQDDRRRLSRDQRRQCARRATAPRRRSPSPMRVIDGPAGGEGRHCGIDLQVRIGIHSGAGGRRGDRRHPDGL